MTRCTCFDAYAGLYRPECPTHGKNWLAARSIEITEPISLKPTQITTLPRDEDHPLYLKGFREGIEAAHKLIAEARNAGK